MVCLSIVFSKTLVELSNDEIAESIIVKANDIYNQVKRVFEEPYYFIDYETMRFVVDDFVEKEFDTLKLVKTNNIHFLDDSSLFGIVNYKITDFADDFDLDGFGLKKAIKLYKDLKDKMELSSKNYILELECNKSNMVDIINSVCPNITQKSINNMMDGSSDDQFISGICFLYGICVRQDFQVAYECFLHSSEKYNSDAFFQLSLMYFKSIYVSFDVSKWLSNLNKACRLGNETAIQSWNLIKKPDHIVKIEFSGMGKVLYARYKDSIKKKYIFVFPQN